MPNSMGIIVKVAIRQNKNKFGIFMKCASTKYTTLNTNVGVNINNKSPALFMVFMV